MMAWSKGMSLCEKDLWRASGEVYQFYLCTMTSTIARACVVTHLRLIADEIEDRSRTPTGQKPG